MNKELPFNLNGLEKEDVYAVATALLYSLKDSPKYSIVSELFYILDYQNFLKLIKYYGGMTIRIPTSDEINSLLRVLLLYQYNKAEGIPWDLALEKAGIPKEESNSVRVKLTCLTKILQTQDIGGRDYE